MKNALILHCTNSNSQGNWYPWLQRSLELEGWKVWVPNLPGSDKPNLETYLNYIFGNKEWQFNDESYIIGHSSGAVAGLGVLQRLQDEIKIAKYIGVGAFKDNLGRDDLKGLFIEPLDYEKIKRHAARLMFLHSEDDKSVPLDQAKALATALDAELIVKKGEGHFHTEDGEKHIQLPFLLEMLTL